MTEIQKIAWIGLGTMGVPMVKRLADGPQEVKAFNRTSKSSVEIGPAQIVPLEAALADADAVFLMVADASAVEDILFGPLKAAEQIKAGALVVNMSTIGVDETHRIAKALQNRGLRFMDAPVSGSVQPAKDGNLVILAGGSSDDFHAAKPLFLRMGKNVFHLGDVGSGAAMKLLMNGFLGLLMEAAGECIALADKSGLTRENFLQVLATTGMWAPILNLKQSMWEKRDYPAAFALKHMTKDLGLASRFAEDSRVSVPALTSALAMFIAARQEGLGEQDMAAVSEYVEGLADG